MSTPADPRDYPLTVPVLPRDAAVDPHESDFLPPTNAGLPGEQGNPHGPHVVAPGLHAAETGGHTIRPGAVSDDPPVQSTEETEHLTTQQPQTAAPGEDPDPEDPPAPV